MNLALNRGPLVCTIFVIFLYMLKSLLLVFLPLIFLHQQELNPKTLDSFQYFWTRFEVWNFCSKFQNQFYSFSFYILPLHLQLPFLQWFLESLRLKSRVKLIPRLGTRITQPFQKPRSWPETAQKSGAWVQPTTRNTGELDRKENFIWGPKTCLMQNILTKRESTPMTQNLTIPLPIVWKFAWRARGRRRIRTRRGDQPHNTDQGVCWPTPAANAGTCWTARLREVLVGKQGTIVPTASAEGVPKSLIHNYRSRTRGNMGERGGSTRRCGAEVRHHRQGGLRQRHRRWLGKHYARQGQQLQI